jgi:hypothetical protein
MLNGRGKKRHPFNISVLMLFLFILKTNSKFVNVFGQFHFWAPHLHLYLFISIETNSHFSLDPLLKMSNYSVIKILTCGDTVRFYCCGQ